MIKKEVSIPVWDMETDVVVLGYGYAGACSAISAKDSGAEVVILEKMPQLGGISILAGGGILGGSNYNDMANYLKVLCSGRTPDEIIDVQVKGMLNIYDYINSLCEINNATLRVSKKGITACYPVHGGENFQVGHITSIPGFNGYPFLKNVTGGSLLMKVLEDNVNHRNIKALYNTSAFELVLDGEHKVIGVKAERNNESKIAIKSRRGIVIATGGFESNEWMKMQFMEAKPVYNISPPCNTGDGIIMAQKAGAALWHMWHIHGSYGFKFPEYRVAFRNVMGGLRSINKKIPWILVDKIKGKRFMNEVHPSPTDTMHRPLQHFDPDLQDFPRIPAWMVFDEKGRRKGPIAKPISMYEEDMYFWSSDNMEEINKGWILKAVDLKDLSNKMEVKEDTFINAINKWNRFYYNQHNEDFERPCGTMMPLETPPFYCVKVWPVVTNTQGGPEHNSRQQVINANKEVIPRLYAAGECGSMYGHLYQCFGNISECIIGGKIAGQNAAKEDLLSF